MISPKVSVEFKLLGPFATRWDDTSIEARLTGPARLLLIYLLSYRNQAHRREALMEAVCSRRSRETRRAFNTTLWRLKKFIKPLPGVRLNCNADTIRLALSEAAQLDSEVLSNALQTREPEHLRWAAELWRGDYAEGVSEDWILALRERCHNNYIHALTLLMRRDGKRQKYHRALDYGRKILAVDPFREAVHSEVMWLYVLTGQRAKAIAQFEYLARLLKAELGIGPMAETRALNDYIRSGLETCAEAAESLPAPLRTARRYEGFLDAVKRSQTMIYEALQSKNPPTH